MVTTEDILVEESSAPAVSWAAVIGGALAATGVTLILLALGAGLGFASLSPWSPPAGTTFGVMAIVWLVVVQWLSSALGGYLAGRLRAKWVGIHTDESTFRDTAHGVLAWALATVLVVFVTSSAASSLAGGAARTATMAAGAAAGSATNQAGPLSGTMGYLTDTVFRSDHLATPTPPELRAEAGRILLTATTDKGVSDADKAYLSKLIAATTGVDQAAATKRVDDAIAGVQKAEADLREAADKARKAAAAFALAMAFSLLIGAFIGGAAGALGGHQREQYGLLVGRRRVP
jgi:hypothetical protein